MSGPEVVQEVNDLSARTWDSKAKNTLRLLDDNGYAGKYVAEQLGSILKVSFYDPIVPTMLLKEFNFDMSADTTHRQFLVAVDDYFGNFDNDRSYDWENDTGPKL